MLKNAEHAVIDRAKMTDYLLCRSHPTGGPKAAFFLRFGFTVERWEVLASALRVVAMSNPIRSSAKSMHGTNYTVEGLIQCPDGRTARIRTVWQIAADGGFPRFISAYPQRALQVRESIMAAIREFERVVLTTDVAGDKLVDGDVGLVAGDVGVVVDILGGGTAYILEFMALDGNTVAVTEVEASQVRPIGPRDLQHVRQVA